MRSLALASAILAAAATASAGCAVIAAKAPDPDRPRNQPPMCNDGKGGVVVDALMATMFGAVTLAVASDSGEAAAITGLAGLGYGISAAAGNSSANKCRAATEEYVAMREREAAEAAFTREHAAEDGAIGGLAIAPEDEDAPAAPAAPAAATPPPPPRTPTPQPQPPKPTATPPKPTPPSRPTPPPKPARDTGGDDGDWSEFWMEVP